METLQIGNCNLSKFPKYHFYFTTNSTGNGASVWAVWHSLWQKAAILFCTWTWQTCQITSVDWGREPIKEAKRYYPATTTTTPHPVLWSGFVRHGITAPPRIFFKLWLHSVDIPSGKLRISSAFSNRNSSVSSHECPSTTPQQHTHYHLCTRPSLLPSHPKPNQLSFAHCPAPGA